MLKKTLILHISNTDIATDSRIIKEINTIKKIKNSKIIGIGLSQNNNFKKRIIDNYTEVLLKLSSKSVLRRWRVLNYSLNMLELIVRMMLYSFKLKPNLIHCHDAFALIPGLILSLFNRSKLIYDAHEFESDKNGQNKLFALITIFIEKISWKKIDVIISVSKSILKKYTSLYGYKKNLLLENRPLISNKKNTINNIKNNLNIDSNKLLFIYVGNLCAGRGIDLSLEVFSKYRTNSYILFLGDGILKDKVLSYSKKFRNIIYHNNINHDKVVDFIRYADVGICFIENISKSDFLCLPNKIFEYAAAGLNILASDLPEISKFLEEYKAGAVSKYSVKNFNEKVKFFEENNLIKVENDCKSYSWQFKEKDLIKIYKELMFAN